MAEPPADAALPRIRAFWRRALLGPSIGARIEVYEEVAPGLGAGMGVREVLRTAAERHRGAKRAAIELLADGVARDVPLSETMRANEQAFTRLEAALVATGERTGRLDVAFRAAAAQLDREKQTRNRIVQACAYPFVLVHVMIILPPIGFIAVSRGIGAYLLFVVPALILVWGGMFAAASVFAGFSHRLGFARALQRVPIVGNVTAAAAVARFTRALGALHGAGLAHDETLRIAAEASGSAIVRADAEVAIYALARGAPMPVALEQMPSIPSDDRALLVAGERSGELESAALKVAQMEDQRFDVVVKRAIAVLPSALIIVIGLIVGALYVKLVYGYYKSISDVLR